MDFEIMEKPWMGDFFKFRVGTCKGLYRATLTHYEILAIKNKVKHNGHFQLTMEYFERSCKRDGKKLLVSEVWNLLLAWHLRKHGFKRVKGTLFCWEKEF